ncbi:MAG: DUF1697 domain-containing protein [Acidiferrobacteraceae bacterium]|jgi:uncharacterized protein (DUF1697 family)
MTARVLLTSYIAMLRGINVGGQKRIRMDDLRALMQGLGYGRVRTYIQSGNLLFEGRKGTARSHEGRIEQAIADQYGYQVACLIRTAPEMKEIASANPFLQRSGYDPAKFHVTFLDGLPKPNLAKELAEVVSGKDEIRVRGGEVYLFCPNGYGKTRYSNTFIERKLGLSATTRNWRTVRQLLEMASAP